MQASPLEEYAIMNNKNWWVQDRNGIAINVARLDWVADYSPIWSGQYRCTHKFYQIILAGNKLEISFEDGSEEHVRFKRLFEEMTKIKL